MKRSTSFSTLILTTAAVVALLGGCDRRSATDPNGTGSGATSGTTSGGMSSGSGTGSTGTGAPAATPSGTPGAAGPGK